MSALGGMYSRDGSPLNESALARLNHGLADMGPDGNDSASIGNVSMFCRPFYTERQPEKTTYVSADNSLITFDGRIDNAHDLILAHQEVHEREISSWPELMLAIYRRFGLEGFARAIGDFSFALWDSVRKTLILGCDSLGRRPLYYLSTSSYIAWASKSRPLAEAFGLNLNIDEECVASFLANIPTERSPYKPIRRVPGAHVLVAGPRETQVKRYWAPNPNISIRYKSDEQYQEHFRSLFFECVRCRIATRDPVFCELSGGLDSSSIACTAHSIVKGRSTDGLNLFTASYVFPLSPTSDERHFIRLTEEKLQKHGLHIDDQNYPMLAWASHSIRPDVPTNCLAFLARHDRLAREMRAEKSRVLLSGIGGDQLFWSEPPVILLLADLLAARRLGRFLEEISFASRLSGWPYPMLLWKSVASTLLRRVVLNDGPRELQMADWFNSEFMKRTEIRRRVELLKYDDLKWSASNAAEWSLVRQTMRVHALERFLSEGYIDVRYPYLDRRLVDFSLAIPLEQKVRRGETRRIVRHAMSDIVPHEICTRTSKAGPDEAFHRAIVRHWYQLSDLCSHLRAADYGFVDPKLFANGLRTARHGLAMNAVQLLRTISLEIWLRSLEEEPLFGPRCAESHSLPLHWGGIAQKRRTSWKNRTARLRMKHQNLWSSKRWKK